MCLHIIKCASPATLSDRLLVSNWWQFLLSLTLLFYISRWKLYTFAAYTGTSHWHVFYGPAHTTHTPLSSHFFPHHFYTFISPRTTCSCPAPNISPGHINRHMTDFIPRIAHMWRETFCCNLLIILHSMDVAHFPGLNDFHSAFHWTTTGRDATRRDEMHGMAMHVHRQSFKLTSPSRSFVDSEPRMSNGSIDPSMCANR